MPVALSLLPCSQEPAYGPREYLLFADAVYELLASGSPADGDYGAPAMLGFCAGSVSVFLACVESSSVVP